MAKSMFSADFANKLCTLNFDKVPHNGPQIKRALWLNLFLALTWSLLWVTYTTYKMEYTGSAYEGEHKNGR